MCAMRSSTPLRVGIGSAHPADPGRVRWTDRINVPALIDDSNWTWRLPWPVDALDAQPEAAERQQALRAGPSGTARV